MAPAPSVLDPTGGVSLAVFFVVGLLGGAHCLGMCGPLVTTYADRMRQGPALTFGEIRGHALFNAGRTLSYATIGAALGLAGGLVFDAADLLAIGATVRAVAGVAVGVLIVAVGVGYLLGGRNVLGVLEHSGPFARVYGALADRVDDWVHGPRIVLLGAVHGFLPCPILYPAFLYALARGSPIEGAAALGALGLGTFPTLFLYGTVLGSVSPAVRRRLHRGLGAAFVVLGYLPLSMGLRSVGVNLPMLPVPYYQPLG
ncbi:MAG: sulfite exporter TauE/SafE family protein [Halobacteriales archaeon]